jgi:putative N6-adenine-specific DNA methylase
MLRLSGWDRARPLVDPMCGAGTIAIEAAAWARKIAPGLGRTRFGFERWALFDDRARMKELREEARAAARKEGPIVRASDVDPRMIETARANARDAGVDLELHPADVRDLTARDAAAAIVTNPPYGERLAVEEAFFRDAARALAALAHHDVTVLAGAPAIAQALEHAFSRKPTSWWIVHNGALECRLLSYRAVPE